MQDFIEIKGARENNLKNVSINIPKHKITVFTGVSGSGKSSIVFDTIANEAQRQLYENFSMFIRNLLPRYPQPEADSIENLSMAIVVDQKNLVVAPIQRWVLSLIFTRYCACSTLVLLSVGAEGRIALPAAALVTVTAMVIAVRGK
jgi:hypothetical protein